MAKEIAMPGILVRQTPYEEKIVFESMQEFSQDVAWRATSAAMWEEIAELLGCSENTSKSQLSKARGLLRKKINKLVNVKTTPAYEKV